MRAPSRRTVSLLAAAVLIVPTTLSAGSVTAAQAGPLCSLFNTCSDAGDSGSGDSGSGGSAPASVPARTLGPGVPTQPKSPTQPEPEPTNTTGSDAPTEPADEPSDDPTEPSDDSTAPGGLGLKDPGDEPDEESNGEFPEQAARDDNAPIFTKTPAAMGSDSLSFKGLKGISFVSVPTADGGSIVTLKIRADEISIEGFSLTVRPPEEDEGLVTEADTMTLKGDVTVYIGSITATTKGGKSLTIGPETPPPMDDVEPGLLRVTMGLVGTIADDISYSNTDQKLKHT